jgi:hypothetical protein
MLYLLMMVNLSEYRHPLGFINQLRIFCQYEQNEMSKFVNLSPLKYVIVWFLWGVHLHIIGI